MRQKIIAGNWKMNNNFIETKVLIKDIKNKIKKIKLENTRVLVSPSFVNLKTGVKKAKNSIIEVIAQNMHQASSGAFTGEVSGEMLKNIGIKTVILGHSERREYFNESDIILVEKINSALKNNLEIIFCFGENLKGRESKNHFNIIENQIKKALFHLKPKDYKNIILAYEPVWAIGTGKTATANQAQEMHSFIRELIKKKYNNKISENISILYGGSVKPNNAKEIFSKPDVDGGLIGGASLNSENFIDIVKSI